MGRELQKKKNRSSNPKVKQKPKSKRINPLGNAIVAANWNSKETLVQNYKRLGLASRLNAPTGGTEHLTATSVSVPSTSTASTLAITTARPTVVKPTLAKVERDASGKIVKVTHSLQKAPNPLNDPLNELDSDEERDDGDVDMEEFNGFEGEEEQNAIVKQLEEQASRVAEKKPRKQSAREKEWCASLVAKYGDNYMAMVRDRKLNPMQQTMPDIKRRIAKYLAEN